MNRFNFDICMDMWKSGVMMVDMLKYHVEKEMLLLEFH